jgi:hypothetical protein
MLSRPSPPPPPMLLPAPLRLALSARGSCCVRLLATSNASSLSGGIVSRVAATHTFFLVSNHHSGCCTHATRSTHKSGVLIHPSSTELSSTCMSFSPSPLRLNVSFLTFCASRGGECCTARWTSSAHQMNAFVQPRTPHTHALQRSTSFSTATQVTLPFPSPSPLACARGAHPHAVDAATQNTHWRCASWFAPMRLARRSDSSRQSF